MLRWMTPFMAAIFAIGTAAADDPPAPKSADSPATKSADSILTPKSSDGTAAPRRAASKNAAVRAASKLPPGLPRAHYNYRTAVAPAAAPLYVRRGRTLVVEEEDPDVLFTPVGVVPYAPRVFGTPLLPGSSTLPGYYGTSHSYSYDGAYYGGPSYGPYWNRLPYACGVYGYC